MTDVDYTDDQALLANTPAQAESILLPIKQAVRSFDLYLNAKKTKTEHMSLNQKKTSLL